MPETFFSMAPDRRLAALEAAGGALDRAPNLLEKDAYEVWALEAMFGSELGEHLVFKGGTSLSKVYQAIARFSEDIDLTYDIREIAKDLIGDRADPMPATRSEEKRWTSEIRKRLVEWVVGVALPLVEAKAKTDILPARISASGDCIMIAYDPVTASEGYVTPTVKLEFGARATGEPSDLHDVVCDASPALADLGFPTARPRVMRIERTFWEKATAVHVFCRQGPIKRDRLARHWYDLTQLHQRGHAAAAIADRDLAMAVADHKAMFFAEKDLSKSVIDYRAAVQGGLRLLPDEGDDLQALRLDYLTMLSQRMFTEEPPDFDGLIAKCKALQDEVNSWEPRKPALTLD